MPKIDDPEKPALRHMIRNRRRRSGYVYVAVLATTSIVSLMALCAIQLSRVQLRIATSGHDWQAARQLAVSGIEVAMAVLNNDKNWKTNYPFNIEHETQGVTSDGRMSWKLTKIDDARIHIDGIGRKGSATCVLRVDVQLPDTTALEVAMLGNLAVVLDSSSERLTIENGTLATNNTLFNFGTITGKCEAKSLIGRLPSGTFTSPGPVRTLPDDQTLWSYYMEHGTDITSGVRANSFNIHDVLLSPNSNPYGARNSEGIYVINLSWNNSLIIEDVRIVGTLVIINADDGVRLSGEINWEPAYPNYPALLVEGPLTVQLTGSRLDEAANSVNYNPASTPWQGTSDLTRDDSYPSGLAGLIFCDGNVTFDGDDRNYSMSHQGVFMTRGICRIRDTARVTLRYDDAALQTPPPGFQNVIAPQIEIGSWRQILSY